jgi:hypothetical protein
MTAYRRNGLGMLFRGFGGRRLNRGAAWGMMIIGALIAFEVSNFNATRFALLDIIGDLAFGGVRWATILAIAFCGIDFAGIARIFTPEQGSDEPVEVWYLFGAWLLAAAMNAVLTWWGVSVAIASHASASGNAVVSASTMTKVVPIFVAVMILLIRILLIGSFSIAGDRLFTTGDRRSYGNSSRPATQNTYRPVSPATLRPASSISRPVQSSPYRPAPKPQQTSFTRPEPTYHNLSFNGQSDNDRPIGA